MKRLAALTIALCLLGTLLAACSNESPTTTAALTTAESTTVPPTTEGPTKNGVPTGWIIGEDTAIEGEITFAIPFKGSQGMDAMIAAFNEVYPNIKVDTFDYSINSSMPMRARFYAGEIDVWAAFGLSSLSKMWEGELSYDLTDLVAEEGIDLTQQWGTDAYTYNDRVYSFPCGGLSYYVAINMDAWKEAGLDEKYNGLPTEWTWDEYIEASRLMTKTNEDGTVRYGGSDYHSTNYFMYTHCQVNGGDMYYDADGTSSYDDPIVLEALERKIKAELEDKIWYPQAKYRGESIQAQTAFCNGEVASTIIPNVTRFLHIEENYPDVDWVTGFAPFPVVEKGQTNYMSGVATYSHAGISSYIDDEKLPAAWAFLKWYATYGSKYLVVAGHQSTWKGTEPGELAPLIYGSEEEAEKWIDLESFNRVVGRADLPAYTETTLTAYNDVSGALSDPIMMCINGEVTPEECLRQALETAEAALEEQHKEDSDVARQTIYQVMEKAENMVEQQVKITVKLTPCTQYYLERNMISMTGAAVQDGDTVTLYPQKNLNAENAMKYLVFLSILEADYADCLIPVEGKEDGLRYAYYFNPTYRQDGYESIQQWCDALDKTQSVRYCITYDEDRRVYRYEGDSAELIYATGWFRN